MQKKLSRLKKHNSCCNFAMFTTNYRTKNWNGIEEVEEISAFHDQTIPNPEPIPYVTMITRYCYLWIQMGPHGFKTCLEGYDPPCRHNENNVLVVSLGIVGQNKQIPLWGQTNPTPRSEIGSNTTCNDPYNDQLPTVQILFVLDPKGPSRL